MKDNNYSILFLSERRGVTIMRKRSFTAVFLIFLLVLTSCPAFGWEKIITPGSGETQSDPLAVEEDGADEEDESRKDLRIIITSAAKDGVKVSLNEAFARKKADTGGFRYSLSGTIENNSDEGIMYVLYTFTFYDVNGEEYRSFGEVFDGQDKAIPPHTSIDFCHDDIVWGPQSVPGSVSVGIKEVKTETQLPPERVPQPGEYLYQAMGDEKLANIKEEPPVEISFHVDQGGYGRTAVFKDGELLDKAVELLCEIKLGEETGEWVTDNYNGIWVTWKDGTSSSISLNLYNLEYSVHSVPHMYELENLDNFWDFASTYLEEDSY